MYQKAAKKGVDRLSEEKGSSQCSNSSLAEVKNSKCSAFPDNLLDLFEVRSHYDRIIQEVMKDAPLAAVICQYNGH